VLTGLSTGKIHVLHRNWPVRVFWSKTAVIMTVIEHVFRSALRRQPQPGLAGPSSAFPGVIAVGIAIMWAFAGKPFPQASQHLGHELLTGHDHDLKESDVVIVGWAGPAAFSQ